MVLLSVLIPSLTSRSEYLHRITSLLTRQINAYKLQKEVEILTLIDIREATTGFKRNTLLNKSKGKFIVFVDDDDLVSDDYLKLICDLIRGEKELDCVGINGVYSCNNQQTPFETHHHNKHSYYGFSELQLKFPPVTIDLLNHSKNSVNH